MSTLLTISNELSCAIVVLGAARRGRPRQLFSFPCRAGKPVLSKEERLGVIEKKRSEVLPILLFGSAWGNRGEQALEVVGSRRGHLVSGDVMQRGQRSGCFHHHGRLVAFAAVGCGSEPGSVGFYEDAVERHPRCHVTKRLRLGIGNVPGKG